MDCASAMPGIDDICVSLQLSCVCSIILKGAAVWLSSLHRRINTRILMPAKCFYMQFGCFGIA